MRALFLFLTLAFIPLAGLSAQDNLTIEHLQIDIWPEYDRQEVLIIYRLSLAESTPLPAKMKLRIPQASGAPFNLAMQDTDNRLYNLDYTINRSGDWLEVSFTTPSPTIQLEYYDPRLIKDNVQRTFEYQWPGDYAVHTLAMRVQQPVNASRMHIQPDLGSGKTEQDGLKYYMALFGSIEKGKPLTIQLSYQKPDNTLSSNLQPVQPIQPINQPIPNPINTNSLLPWLMAVIGLVLILSSFLWYFRTEKTKLHPKRQQNDALLEKKASQTSSTTASFCHLCGKRALPGDLFCRSCGARLR
ncbi:MAG: zinc ribbon domain-containing protein [Anaerolineae bacterium]|nr:zinc ribbon domain-containing protein [Anaerolineae bacterium]